MQIGRIQGFTRVVGKKQGYPGLPVRDVVIESNVAGPGTRAMETAWLPMPNELAALNAGAPIVLRVYGTVHPPVLLYAGAVPA
jgi:hypothetical protein